VKDNDKRGSLSALTHKLRRLDVLGGFARYACLGVDTNNPYYKTSKFTMFTIAERKRGIKKKFRVSRVINLFLKGMHLCCSEQYVPQE
jgi:hypothetical protein